MNIGMPLTEFVLESVLRDGLGELRASPVKLNYLFSRFKEAQFNNQYGQAKIDQVQTYLERNQIRIVQAFSLNATSIPCISIQIIASEETPERQHFGNEYEPLLDAKDRTVIAASIHPSAYNSTTGKLTVPDSEDLSLVIPNQVFIDCAGNEFTITSGISNLMGSKFISIEKGAEPDLTDPGQVVDPIDFTAYERGMVRLTETIRLGIHAKDDPHITKFIYYIVYSILKSRQKSLITRGIHLDYGMISALDRVEQMGEENVFTRFIDLKCLTEFNFLIDPIAVASSFDLSLFVPDPNPNSPTKRKL